MLPDSAKRHWMCSEEIVTPPFPSLSSHFHKSFASIHSEQIRTAAFHAADRRHICQRAKRLRVRMLVFRDTFEKRNQLSLKFSICPSLDSDKRIMLRCWLNTELRRNENFQQIRNFCDEKRRCTIVFWHFRPDVELVSPATFTGQKYDYTLIRPFQVSQVYAVKSYGSCLICQQWRHNINAIHALPRYRQFSSQYNCFHYF